MQFTAFQKLFYSEQYILHFVKYNKFDIFMFGDEDLIEAMLTKARLVELLCLATRPLVPKL